MGHGHQPGAGEMLAQQHTEHGRLRGVFRVGGGQMEPGRGRIGIDQKLGPVFPATQVQDHRVPAGLVDLVHPGFAQLPDLL